MSKIKKRVAESLDFLLHVFLVILGFFFGIVLFNFFIYGSIYETTS